MEDLKQFCCQNPRCPDHGKREGSNLSVCGHFGRGKRLRLLYCRTCKARFSERKGTALFRSRLPEEKMDAIFQHLAEGCGVRCTSRLTGAHRDTISRLSKVAGGHAKALHEELAAFSPSDPRGSDGRKMGFRGPKGGSVRGR
jgi:LacI family transcriptional regulator